MPHPEYFPQPKITHKVLPSKGSIANVASTTNPLPYGIYLDEEEFIRGAADQVGYVYRMLNGDVAQLELTEYNVYAAYEDAVLEYSNIMNMHQAKNVIGSALGNKTGSFDEDGNLRGATDDEVQPGDHAELKYPKFDFAAAKRIGNAASSEADVGGFEDLYQGRFAIVQGQQDYDLQEIMQEVSDTNENSDFYGKIGELANNTQIQVKKVYYQTPGTAWRFYGQFGGYGGVSFMGGGIGGIGGMSSYGMWAGGTAFQVVPVWQNRLQMKAFEESLYVRASHYSFRIVNNKLRIFPVPMNMSPDYMFIEFSIPSDLWSEDEDGGSSGTNGINNINTLPFENIPFVSINSMGKVWIRKYALATCKEILGYARRKLSQLPIPGENITLDGMQMREEGEREKQRLAEELKGDLATTTYDELLKKDKEMVENAQVVLDAVPLPIFMG
jgi:hypothetical protein